MGFTYKLGHGADTGKIFKTIFFNLIFSLSPAPYFLKHSATAGQLTCLENIFLTKFDQIFRSLVTKFANYLWNVGLILAANVAIFWICLAIFGNLWMLADE
jgi:hypothetical protein